MLYFDHAASSELSESVREAMLVWLTREHANPSARHAAGGRAAGALDAARESVALAMGVRQGRVIFTSGGTEANNLGLLGAVRARRARKEARHLLIGPTEHPSVLEAARSLREEGYELEHMRLDASGALDLKDAARRLRPDTLLVAQMLVQNEVGTVYPVEELGQLVRKLAPSAHYHVDGIQALGKLELTLAATGADSLALSAHKVHGPKGAGALVIGEKARFAPLCFGGGQEGGLRSGTENVPGIVGMGVAVAEACQELSSRRGRLLELRERFLRGLESVPGVRSVEPGRAARGVSPAIAALLVAGAPAEVWQHHLEAEFVMVATGSACQSKKREASPTAAALGWSAEEGRALLRFSFAHTNTVAEVEYALRALGRVAERLRSVRE